MQGELVSAGPQKLQAHLALRVATEGVPVSRVRALLVDRL